MQIYTDAELVEARKDLLPRTVNTMLRITKPTLITEAAPYNSYLDLFNIRNLYLTSSALANYDTVSNFGMDTIIKKKPVHSSIQQDDFSELGLDTRRLRREQTNPSISRFQTCRYQLSPYRFARKPF